MVRHGGQHQPAGLLPDSGNPEVPFFSPLDYWFWSVCVSELRRNPPTSLLVLIDIVNQYADSMEEEEIKKACKNIRFMARAALILGVELLSTSSKNVPQVLLKKLIHTTQNNY